jgi:hypothetical protein
MIHCLSAQNLANNNIILLSPLQVHKSFHFYKNNNNNNVAPRQLILVPLLKPTAINIHIKIIKVFSGISLFK